MAASKDAFGTLQITRSEALPATFQVSGELDLSNVALLMQAVDPVAAPGAELTLQLEKLEFMDSSGIQALVNIARRLEPDGRLVLTTPTDAVRKVLWLVGADRFPGFSIDAP